MTIAAAPVATVRAPNELAHRPISFTRQPLDFRRIVFETFCILAILLLNRAGTPGAVVFFVLLAGMVVKSPKAAFQAIAICYLGLMINTAFVPKTIPWTIGRLALPIFAFLRFSVDLAGLRASLFENKSYLAFVFYVLVMALCSTLSGWFTSIALLKLFNFWMFVSTIMAGVFVLQKKRIDVTEWFFALIASATTIGIAAVALGASQNFRPGAYVTLEHFNGAFLHPNCHALYASMFVTFMLTLALMGNYRNSWLTLPLIATWLVFISVSRSRTAVLATTVGFGTYVFYARPLRNRLGWRLRLRLSRGKLLSIGAVAAISVVILDIGLGGSITKSMVGFINKAGKEEVQDLDTEQILRSRASVIDLSMQNFRENPIFGIGFQVAKTDFFIKNATLFTAPTEKGFLPSAVLEEGGVVGTAAFVVFIVALMWEFASRRNIPALVVFVTFLTSNLGEVSLFSPGGLGAFGWTMVGAAMVLGDHCWLPPAASHHNYPRN